MHRQLNRSTGLIACSFLAASCLAVSAGHAVAQQPRLLADLVPGAGSDLGSSPDNFALVGGRVFFTGATQGPGPSVEQIRVYSILPDGSDLRNHGRVDDPALLRVTVAGTGVVGDEFLVGIGGTSAIRAILAFNADSVAARTVQVPDQPDPPASFAALQGTGRSFLLVQSFAAGNSTIDVLSPDGTLARIFSNRSSFMNLPTDPIAATTIGGNLIFSGNSGINGATREPWFSDGTADGTRQIIALAPGFANGSRPTVFTALGNRAVFEASDGSSRNFYITDGTAAGTTLLATPTSLGLGSTGATAARSFNGEVYIVRAGSLVVTDGTPNGTRRVATTQAGAALTNVASIHAIVGNRVILSRGTVSGSFEFFATGGTPQTTESLATVTGNISPTGESGFQTLSAGSFLVGSTGSFPSVSAIVRTDATAAGTSVDTGLAGTVALGASKSVLLPSGRLVFSGNLEPWSTGPMAGASRITNVVATTAAGKVRLLGSLGERRVVSAAGRLFVASAVGTATESVSEVTVSNTAKPWAELPTGALFAASGSVNSLYYTAGPDAPAQPVFAHAADGPLAVSSMTRVGQHVFFADFSGTGRIWRSDGTAAGTSIVFTLPTGSVQDMVSFAGEAWFLGGTGLSLQLYRTDGDTTTVVSSVPTDAASTPSPLSSSATRLFLTLPTLNTVRSFSASGASRTLSLGTFPPRTFAVDSTGFIGVLYRPQQLVRWDGASTTFTVLSEGPAIQGFSTSTRTRQLATLPGKVIYVRVTPMEGDEVYAFDESTGETELLRDVVPGPVGSSASAMRTIGNRVYWIAFTPGQGHEVWSTDGTPEGTRLVTPINGTERSSVIPELSFPVDPRFAPLGSLVLFGADDGTTGEEPWVVALCPADFNSDGESNPDDMDDYITAFFTVPPLPATDIDSNGAVDPDDLADFISVFFGGCD